MNVLMLYQNDPKDADTAAALLNEAGHETRRESATTVLDGSVSAQPADMVIVFAETYKEKETYAVCERLRESDLLRDTPLLVAVNMYQMPLANQVKAMPNSGFIFLPIDDQSFEDRVGMLTGNSEEQQNQQG